MKGSLDVGRAVRQAGGDPHLGLVLAVLSLIPSPQEKIRWLRNRMPGTAAMFGVDNALLFGDKAAENSQDVDPAA